MKLEIQINIFATAAVENIYYTYTYAIKSASHSFKCMALGCRLQSKPVANHPTELNC